MEKVNELERFLRGQADGGRRDSEGGFSLSRSEALKKLSEFSLPFDGAWALKVIQAGVATEQCRGIQVTLSRNTQSFVFENVDRWSLDQIEKALLEPSPSEDRSVNHLVAALRGVGFNERRGFWLGLPDCEEALTWDGERIERVEANTPPLAPVLQVTCKAIDEDGGFLGLSGMLAARGRNATTGQVLATMAHTCPLPLRVDGRRIDALELNPHHGWGQQSQILALGFCDGDLPELGVPSQTGEFTDTTQSIESYLKEATKELRKRPESRQYCSVAYLLSVHLEEERKGKSTSWEERESHSYCNWVADGVIAQTETLDTEPGLCSVGWFVSADGLETDLTNLQLRESPEKERRFAHSVELVASGLGQVASFDFSEVARSQGSDAAKIGGSLLVLGAGGFFLSPAHGVVSTVIGLGFLLSSRVIGKARVESIHNGLADLLEEFGAGGDCHESDQ
ncbi:MAG: hypothetical protein KC800_08680 [Candidatus Eremiobacteraeota bacterium]|nr:hypothetical protein [Candidatus Eremiobacteraeota bacterium]